MSTILLVTNDNEIKNLFKQNLVLLRNNDKLISVDYENAMEVIYDKIPEVVILHQNEKSRNSLELVSYLKTKKVFSNTCVILFVNKYDRSLILSAFDVGIDDFIVAGNDSSEILIRTINGIKKSSALKYRQQLTNILGHFDVIDERTNFYSPKYESEIISAELNNNAGSDYTHIILTPDEESKKRFSNENFIAALKKSVRTCDIVFGANGSRYSLLLKTNPEGAIRIYEKIKSEIGSDYKLKAGISSVENKNAEEIKKRSTCALNNALLESEAEYVIYSKEEPQNDVWLDVPKDNDQTYKFLKKVFTKKIENVIAPVFYRLQKTYEDRLPNAKIEQFTDIEQSVFRITKENNEGRITMRYPSYSKLIIYISHSGFDTPESKEIVLAISEVTEQKLDEIVESFINEFVSMHYN